MRSLFLVFLLAMVLQTCQQDEKVYSCDPILNEYITIHKEELRSISVLELSNSDIAFQQAVFRSFDAEKKREVWMQRIQILLETQDYSPEEFAHVKILLGHLQTGNYEEKNLESGLRERRQFASEWIKKAKDDLRWSDWQIAFVAYRIYTNKTQFENELRIAETVHLNDGIEPITNCSCNILSEYCVTKYCVTGSCNILSTGCGFLWSEKCDGICR